jgi:hypothetical protein
MDVEAAAKAASLLKDRPEADMATMGVCYADGSGQAVIRRAVPTGPMTQEGLCFGLPAINGRFFRRSAFEHWGLFRQDLAMASDRMWLMQALQGGLQEVIAQDIVYTYRMHPGSASMGGTRDVRQRLRREHLTMTRKLLADGVEHDMWTACRRLRALEGIKLLAEGGDRQAILTDLGELDHRWVVSAANAVQPWLAWRGRHSSRA